MVLHSFHTLRAIVTLDGLCNTFHTTPPLPQPSSLIFSKSCAFNSPISFFCVRNWSSATRCCSSIFWSSISMSATFCVTPSTVDELEIKAQKWCLTLMFHNSMHNVILHIWIWVACSVIYTYISDGEFPGSPGNGLFPVDKVNSGTFFFPLYAMFDKLLQFSENI